MFVPHQLNYLNPPHIFEFVVVIIVFSVEYNIRQDNNSHFLRKCDAISYCKGNYLYSTEYEM